MQKIDNEILAYESEKQIINDKISELREALEAKKITSGEKTAQRDSLKENTEIPLADIEKSIISIDSNENVDELEKFIDKIKVKIDNLGAINLAAIDELQEQQER